MPIHRRQLPIAHPCEAFVPAPGSADEGGFCERCRKEVHDVSAMRESELRRFLAARVGTKVCLSYRTDARGWLHLRPEPEPMHATLAVGALALLLAACAGHAAELELPGEGCRDADGYAVSCDGWAAPEMLSMPAAETVPAGDPEAEGCPIRPTAPEPEAEATGGPEPVLEPDLEARRIVVPSPRHVTPAVPLPSRVTVGDMVVTTATVRPEPGFVPSVELWREWRERRAERKRARERWRASQRASASR